jgi:3D (Asp-Asp-Asp) domain-containing protein
MRTVVTACLILILCSAINACKAKEEYIWKSMAVTASAYNSTPAQTANHFSLAAWGDTLRPGMKCIAVSRDLLNMGFEQNTQVKIPGLRGIYLVKDKMHYRWRKRIDIYMGRDIAKAREWGVKKLEIEYAVKRSPKENNSKVAN